MSNDFDVVTHCNSLSPKLQSTCQEYAKSCVKQRDDGKKDGYELDLVNGKKLTMKSFKTCVRLAIRVSTALGASPKTKAKQVERSLEVRDITSTPTEVKTVLIRNQKVKILCADPDVPYFHGSSVELAEDTTFRIGNRDISAMKGRLITFYSNGSVRTMALAKETTVRIGRRNFLAMKGGSIHFTSDGNPHKIVFAEDTVFPIGGYRFMAVKGKLSSLYPNGKIRSMTLAKDIALIAKGRRTIHLKKGRVIRFNPDGTIDS